MARRPIRWAVAGVVGMDEDGHAGRQQFRPGGGNGQGRAIIDAEEQRVKRRLALQVVLLGLGDGRAALRAPQCRRLLLVGQAAAQQVEEAPLGHAARFVVDGAVGVAPVDRQAQPPPDGLVLGLDLGSHSQALADEGGAADVGGAHPARPLHQPLGRQAVVVVAHGVEDVVAAHAPVAGEEVGVGVGVDVAQVEPARDGGRRGVDGVDGRVVRRLEVVDAGCVPLLLSDPLGRQGVVLLSQAHGVIPPRKLKQPIVTTRTKGLCFRGTTSVRRLPGALVPRPLSGQRVNGRTRAGLLRAAARFFGSQRGRPSALFHRGGFQPLAPASLSAGVARTPSGSGVYAIRSHYKGPLACQSWQMRGGGGGRGHMVLEQYTPLEAQDRPPDDDRLVR